MLSGAPNAGREGLPSFMRQRIASLVSPHITKTGQEPTFTEMGAFYPVLGWFELSAGLLYTTDADVIQHVAFLTSLLGRFVRMALAITSKR
jgi:hypothetical protein